jgi:hypothetical protein
MSAAAAAVAAAAHFGDRVKVFWLGGQISVGREGHLRGGVCLPHCLGHSDPMPYPPNKALHHSVTKRCHCTLSPRADNLQYPRAFSGSQGVGGWSDYASPSYSSRKLPNVQVAEVYAAVSRRKLHRDCCVGLKKETLPTDRVRQAGGTAGRLPGSPLLLH